MNYLNIWLAESIKFTSCRWECWEYILPWVERRFGSFQIWDEPVSFAWTGCIFRSTLTSRTGESSLTPTLDFSADSKEEASSVCPNRSSHVMDSAGTARAYCMGSPKATVLVWKATPCLRSWRVVERTFPCYEGDISIHLHDDCSGYSATGHSTASSRTGREESGNRNVEVGNRR